MAVQSNNKKDSNFYNTSIEEKLQFLKDYCSASNAATGSKYDANANVEKKNITTLMGELPKKDNILLNRKLLHDRISEMYGIETADKYLELLNSHILYKNDESSLSSYCASITMYPWLLDGTKSIGGISEAPKNLKSFCGGFINLVFMVSSMIAGAVATPEFLMYMSHFIEVEYGSDYYKRADDVVDLSLKHRTIDNIITDCFQQVVYSINQPAGTRNFQSVFWNISYYDKYYFESLFENFVFPDGTTPNWNAVNWLQKRFMKWLNAERCKTVLTFPVETVAMLTENNDIKDADCADFTSEMYAEGHSFFVYLSDRADSISACCLKGDEVIKLYDKDDNVCYTKIKDFVDYNDPTIKQNGNKVLKEDTYIDSYNELGECSKSKIVGTLKKEYSGAMFTFNVDGKFITVTADHQMMVRDPDGNVISLRADEVAKNIDVYELAVE